jgi:hypothetical protein
MSLYIQLLKLTGTDNKNYYKFAAYATKNLTDDVAHKAVLHHSHLVTVAWEKAEASNKNDR